MLDSDWGEVQPRADDENRYLRSHSWDAYGEWHLGLTEAPRTRRRPATRSCSATSGGSTGPRSSRANSGRPSGATKRSSSPPTTCSRPSTAERRHRGPLIEGPRRPRPISVRRASGTGGRASPPDPRKPRVDLGRLDDRRRRRHQPVEPLRQDSPRSVRRPVAVGDPHDGLEVVADDLRVAVGRHRDEDALVEQHPGAEESPRPRHQHDPRVEHLAALDPRDHPHDRVLERRHEAARARSASATNARGASRRATGSRRTPAMGVRAGSPVLGRQPVVGDRRGQPLEHGRRDERRQPGVGVLDRATRTAAARGRGSPRKAGARALPGRATCGGCTARTRGR